MTLTLTGDTVFLALFVLAVMLSAAYGPVASLGDRARRFMAWTALVAFVCTVVAVVLTVIHR